MPSTLSRNDFELPFSTAFARTHVRSKSRWVSLLEVDKLTILAPVSSHFGRENDTIGVSPVQSRSTSPASISEMPGSDSFTREGTQLYNSEIGRRKKLTP
jgi:hypothetical protein